MGAIASMAPKLGPVRCFWILCGRYCNMNNGEKVMNNSKEFYLNRNKNYLASNMSVWSMFPSSIML